MQAIEIGKPIPPHKFEVYEGENPNNPENWCKHCNCTRSEVPELHIQEQ